MATPSGSGTHRSPGTTSTTVGRTSNYALTDVSPGRKPGDTSVPKDKGQKETGSMAKLPAGVIVAVIALAVVVIAYFGWRTLSGGPNGDITQNKIKYYDAQQKKLEAHKF